MPYQIADVELSKQLAQLRLSAAEDGFAVVARWQGRLVGFLMQPAPRGSTITQTRLRELLEDRIAARIIAVKAETALAARWPLPESLVPPTLSVAICTKDRAARLKRLLDSLVGVGVGSPFRSVEVIVVDNASVDHKTREVVAGFEGVRYRFEPRPGLNCARNVALRAASGDWVAFLDDDVVIDRGWLAGLYQAWARCPDAGGCTGVVLSYSLDTKAQIYFESNGGFSHGFQRLFHRSATFYNPLYPSCVGVVGTGCNMAFDRRLLVSLGGFDEAMDTAHDAPLPGGGDLDMLYRVLRAGRTIVYEPDCAVFHEHRETMEQLRRQYWTWGLGFLAFLSKARRSDPALRRQHMAMVRWWTLDKLEAMSVSALGLRPIRRPFLVAELWGGLMGWFGGYERSQARLRRVDEKAY